MTTIVKKPHTIIKQALPGKLYHVVDFNLRITHALDKCVNQESFHKLLFTQGIDLSSFYHLLKNQFPNGISYKQNGEKKLHLSFAKALQDSMYCVGEIKGRFFIFYDDNVPEEATIISYTESSENGQ